jgi:hypothetical protein
MKEETDKNKITAGAFSALYIYNQINAGCDYGSMINNACQLLVDEGDVLYANYDQDDYRCARKPTPEDQAAASNYKILDWMKLFEIEDPAEKKVQATKAALAQYRPVIIGMKLRSGFQDVKEYWDPNSGGQGYSGGHAMTVIGYDDYKEAFEVMNSWGTDWGNEGYFWIKYDDYAEVTKYGYQLIIGEPGTTKVDLAGDFKFRYPTKITASSAEFANAEVLRTTDYYELQGDWALGSMFQLVSSEVPGNTYVYVFSYDPEGVVNVHWPRDGTLSSNFDGANERPLIYNEDVEIIIPNEETVLSFEKSGADYVCVLYSAKPIFDVKEKLDKLAGVDGDFNAKLTTAFAGELIDPNKIIWEESDMRFTASSSVGYVVPLVLKVDVK